MINEKAILVGVDGSHASYKATWWAANFAKHAGLTLQIVCAYSLPSYAAVSFDATYTAMGDDNAAHSDAQEILSKAKAIADEQGVEAATLIVTGDPASVFVELSRNYNLIVIGNRGKGGLADRRRALYRRRRQPDAPEQHDHQGGGRLRRVEVGSEGAGHRRLVRQHVGCRTRRDLRRAEGAGIRRRQGRDGILHGGS